MALRDISPIGADRAAGHPVAASEVQLRRADTRVRVVARVEALLDRGVSAGRAVAIAADEAGVSVATVQRWRRRNSADGRVAAQMDRPGRGRRAVIRDPAMVACLEDHLFRRGRRVGAAYLHAVLLDRFGAGVPTARTVARWIARWWEEHARDAMIVTAPDTARGRLMPAVGDAAARATAPNAVWEMDSTTADIMCTDGRRPTLVACVDVWTRRARVLVVPTSRADAVCALLRGCILAWGVPTAVRTDRGSDYASAQVSRALADLGIEHLLCAPYHPEAKPHVERWFGSLAAGCLAHLPGYVGRSAAEAAEIRDRLSYGGRRGKGSAEVYGAELDRAALQALIDAWCEDVYGWRPHAGLGGVAPHARAAEWTGPVRRVANERALDLLLTSPGGPAARRVLKGYVHVDGARYAAPELGAMGGARVRVLRDVSDAGQVWVFGPAGYVCTAVDPTLAGVDRAALAARSMAAWRGALGEARQRARTAARDGGAARSMAEHVLGPAARRAAKVRFFPRASQEHRTPALDAAAEAASADERRTETPAAAVGDGPRSVADAVRKLLRGPAGG